MVRRPFRVRLLAIVRPLRRLRGDALASLVYVGGLAAIAAGCWQVFPPAGLIAGGLLAAGSALAYARGS